MKDTILRGFRHTDDSTFVYFRSDSLGKNEVVHLGYLTNPEEEVLPLPELLQALGFGETAAELMAEAADWRFMTVDEIERCPFNHGAIATLIPMPSDFQHGLVEAETLKGMVATMASAPVDLATALAAMAKGTVVMFEEAPPRPDFSLDAFREAIKFNFSMHPTPVAMSHEGEAALAALVGAAKEHLRRDDSCWTFAKSGEPPRAEMFDLSKLTKAELIALQRLEGMIGDAINIFETFRTSLETENPMHLWGVASQYMAGGAACLFSSAIEKSGARPTAIAFVTMAEKVWADHSNILEPEAGAAS